jgi:hypothetical protein
MSTFDDLLTDRPAPVRSTARAVRSFIHSLGGDVGEQIAGNEARYERGRVFCTLVIERSEVQLRFPARGAPSAARPARRGDKGIRSIGLRAPTDFSSAVRTLIRQAYEQAA